MTWAELPGATPTYIFPFMSGAVFTGPNYADLQGQLFRPLYNYGIGNKPIINLSLSLASLPVYSNKNSTVTINLKSYRWSNGEAVSSGDVMFWMNMLKAEKANWGAYVPGALPDDVASMKVDSPTQLTLNLTSPVNTRWFTYNELSQITPMPAAWDVTGPGVVSHCRTIISDCTAVYNYLNGQAKLLSTYSTNPLWKVVDGPWSLQAFTTDGSVTLVPNKDYSGPVKPRIAKFIEQPFTTDTAEYNALRAGNGPTIGYAPIQDVPPLPPGTPLSVGGTNPVSGYRMKPWPLFGITYTLINFNNPAASPLFKQLYIRQALQMTVDQSGFIKGPLKGYGNANYGPIPSVPSNPFVSSQGRTDRYPFSPSRAASLLESHGWRLAAGKPAVCTNPGSGGGQCGSGIAAGKQMSFNLLYGTVGVAETTIMEAWKSDASKAGIVLNLSAVPPNAAVAEASACTAVQSACKWQLANWGSTWTYKPDYYPTGGELFGTGAGVNAGSYSDATNDANIKATHISPDPQTALDTYQNYLAQQLPVIWQPTPVSQLTEIANNLAGYGEQPPYRNIEPATWYFTK